MQHGFAIQERIYHVDVPILSIIFNAEMFASGSCMLRMNAYTNWRDEQQVENLRNVKQQYARY